MLGKPIDTVIGLNDGIDQGRSIPFMLKSYFISGGGFPPCYQHFYSDTEMKKIASHHKKWIFLDNIKVIHHHVYSKKRGLKNIDILEPAISLKFKNSADIYNKRMNWWEANNKPRTIPYNIGI